jgi:bacterioferritin-associated ferredoxin
MFRDTLFAGARREKYNRLMALNPDDIVCYCFHVNRRKIETFCNVEKPQVASQISDCLSAGTGCGWCVPMLKKIHLRLCGENIPWWREKPAEEPGRNDEALDAEAYKAGRRKYIDDGKGVPAPGAEI